MPKITDLDWGTWLYGLVGGFIGGGANAVVSGVTITVMDPAQFSIYQPKFWVFFTSTFVASGVISAMLFLKQRPLPGVKGAPAPPAQ